MMCAPMSMREYVRNDVQECRARASITQEELARAVGVSRQTIIAVERGNYTPSVHLALKLARYFKKPLEEIFTIHNSQ
jgi:putative transcriptional regulator